MLEMTPCDVVANLNARKALFKLNNIYTEFHDRSAKSNDKRVILNYEFYSITEFGDFE